jgi:hypothetical protein
MRAKTPLPLQIAYASSRFQFYTIESILALTSLNPDFLSILIHLLLHKLIRTNLEQSRGLFESNTSNQAKS